MHYGNHPFETIIQPQVFQTLQLATQQNLEDVMVYLSHLRAQKVTTACLRDLLTHGAMTNDAILNTFLAILCAEHDTTFLSTFIIYILRRDKSWEGVRHWFATSPSLQTTSTPLVNSTSPIFIPCHVNDSHWVVVVRRVIKNRVCFLYADDLNQLKTEDELRTLLKAQAPS